MSLRSTPTLDGDDQTNAQEVDVSTTEENETTEEPVAEETGSEQEEETQVEETSETNAYDEAWDKVDTEVGFEEFFSGTETATGSEEESQAEEKPEEQPEPLQQTGLVIENPILKFKGKEIPVESAEELINLAQKGLKLEIEMGKIKPQKRMLSIIENGGLSEEHIKALADALSGKREALEYIASQAGIELQSEESSIFDEETKPSQDYNPSVEPQDPVKEFWESFTQDNPAESAKVIEVYNDLDESFKAEIYKPDIFPMFVGSVVSGEFDQAYPVAVKLKAMNPAATWLQAYAQAAQNVVNGTQQEVPQTKEPSPAVSVRKSTVKESKPRKEKDIEKRIWNDDSYEEELLNKLFD